jgi:phosphate acetyltransferase
VPLKLCYNEAVKITEAPARYESVSLQRKSMAEYIPKVLFPEVQDPAVEAVQQQYGNRPDLDMSLEFADIPLKEAVDKLNHNEVDIVIAGVAHDTPTVLRHAIHDINKVIEPDVKQPITSFFVMEKEGQDPLFFADCAVWEYPEPEMLVRIAEDTSQSVIDLGYEPVVAFISISTFGSAAHLTSVKKVKEATETFKQKHPEIVSYGEIQWDAARNSEIFKKKAAKAGVEIIDGKMPNVFIFPDGVSGNMQYKGYEQDAGYTAVGPMLNGVKKDLHDSSRGASPQGLFRQAVVATALWQARQARKHDVDDQEVKVLAL